MHSKFWMAVSIMTGVAIVNETAHGQRFLTETEWAGHNSAMDVVTVRPAGIKPDFESYGLSRVDAKWFKTPATEAHAKFRVMHLAAVDHAVHFVPADAEALCPFLLRLRMKYDVLEPAPVCLSSDDAISYWHVMNYATGARGALFSTERLDLSHPGEHVVEIPVRRAAADLRKGTALIMRHHFWQIRAAGDDALLDYTVAHSHPKMFYGVTDYGVGDMQFLPELLFVAADLSDFTLALEDAWSSGPAGTEFRVALHLRDAAGEVFAMPRADIHATVIGTDGRSAQMALTPALYPHAVPKGWFAGALPLDIPMGKIMVRAVVSYIDPLGQPAARTVEREFDVADLRPAPAARASDHGASPAPAKETRLLWQNSGWCHTPAGIDRTIEQAKRANLNVVVILDLHPGPVSATNTFDALACAVEKAHAAGLELHVGLTCLMLGMDEAVNFRMREVRYLDYCTVARICPSDERYAELMAKKARALCAYGVDGILLDTIRYGEEPCLCGACRRDYQKQTGYDLAADFKNYYPYPMRLTAWQEFNITRIVSAVSAAARAGKPDVKVGIAAFALSSPLNRFRTGTVQGQPAHLWLEQGLLDYICPMLYAHNIWECVIRGKDYLHAAPQAGQVCGMLDLLERFKANPKHACRTVACTLAQVEAMRREGFTGFAFYFAPWLSDETGDALRNGPFNAPAVPFWR